LTVDATLTGADLRAQIGVKSQVGIGESSIPEFKTILDVNVLGMFLAVRAETRAMKKQEPRLLSSKNPKRGESRGVIINMGSCSSYAATPQMVQYTTSKHAVLGLTRNAGERICSSLTARRII
jgi:NAD(P)-dependent dehydrogenase (short-subunit alcohol dehydrogenase family)